MHALTHACTHARACVLTRYMIRKMREKLTVVQEGHKRMEESHFELHALLVKEQQKNEALDLELARHVTKLVTKRDTS